MLVDPRDFAALLAGVATHIFFFNRSEHHFYGVRYLQAFLVICATAIGAQIRLYNTPARLAFSVTAEIATFFLTGLYSSLLFYRAFLHPLNKFPGPFPARLTNFWYTSQVAGTADAHRKLVDLHAKYGDFLRIGSSDLSIVHPKAPNALYGLGTKCSKAPWYENDAPLTSMHTSRSRQMHDRRRRIWSAGFSDKALRDYEARIKPFSDQLTEQIAAFGGKPLNASAWFNYYSFDVMGDLAFGEAFDMLANGEEHWAIKLLNEGMEPLHLMLPPWCFRVLTAVPGLSAGYWKFIRYCQQKLEARMNRKVETPDIMSTLLEPYKDKAKPEGRELTYLEGDARLIIVAGSDTTAATLTHLFYHLAADPSRVDKLRAELKEHVSPEGDVNHADIINLPYLNGCINEALRLNPPVPSAVQRMTPPEGITIGDTFVPGNMTVWSPQYVIGRSEEVYTKPYEFMPERWDPENDKDIKEKTAFAPFSLGVYGCIGKPLALMEIRTITTKLIFNFDVSLAPNEDGKKLLNETRDHFTLGLQELNLCFKKKS